MAKIGIFTGTFDPIHLGHVELAKAARRECGLDEVWFWVNAKRVNSLAEHKVGVTAYGHRLAMVELATGGEAGTLVYDGELAEGPHSMETFQDLMRRNPSDKFVFIVGMDTIARLDRWDDVESVVGNTSFVVAHRPGTSASELRDLKERLGGLGDALEVRLFDFDEHKSASSLEIRRQVRAGERPESLNERVYEYILKHNLYR